MPKYTRQPIWGNACDYPKATLPPPMNTPPTTEKDRRPILRFIGEQQHGARFQAIVGFKTLACINMSDDSLSRRLGQWKASGLVVQKQKCGPYRLTDEGREFAGEVE